MDIVLFLADREFVRFLRAARRHGFAVDEDLAYTQIQVSGWSRIPLGTDDSVWHLDVTLGDSPFDASARSRRRQVDLLGCTVQVASPEDLVIYKTLAALLDTDRRWDGFDVEAVFRRLGSALDIDYLRTWAGFWEQQDIRGVARQIEDLWTRYG